MDMARGSHPASLANLVAGRRGGDTWAAARAGRDLLIEAIRENLENTAATEEIRAFFCLKPAQLLKPRHIERWAKVKAPRVFEALRNNLRNNASYSAGFNIAGFVRMRTYGARALYPVMVGGGPVADDEVVHVDAVFAGPVGSWEELPVGLPALQAMYSAADVRNIFDSPETHASSVHSGLGLVRVPRKALYKFHAVEIEEDFERVIDSNAYAAAWARLEYDEAAPGGSRIVGAQYLTVAEALALKNEWAARMVPPALPLEVLPEVYIFDSSTAWDCYGKDEVLALFNRPIENPWDWEFPFLGVGRGGTAAEIAKIFPRYQAIVARVTNGAYQFDDVEWMDCEAWMVHYGSVRGAYLAAGAVVPPSSCPPRSRRIEVTFAPEFIGAIQ
jgi:hypothetical protein